MRSTARRALALGRDYYDRATARGELSVQKLDVLPAEAIRLCSLGHFTTNHPRETAATAQMSSMPTRMQPRGLPSTSPNDFSISSREWSCGGTSANRRLPQMWQRPHPLQ
jgi:hypothetical protein